MFMVNLADLLDCLLYSKCVFFGGMNLHQVSWAFLEKTQEQTPSNSVYER